MITCACLLNKKLTCFSLAEFSLVVTLAESTDIICTVVIAKWAAVWISFGSLYQVHRVCTNKCTRLAPIGWLKLKENILSKTA